MWIAWIGGRERGGPLEQLASLYIGRTAPYATVEAKAFRSESAFWEAVGRIGGRTAPLVALLDSGGKMLSSEEFAAWIGRQRDAGVQKLIFAVGPADGWSAESKTKVAQLLSLGPMTLPHELARVVLAEQVYRGFTILAGHPYHRE